MPNEGQFAQMETDRERRAATRSRKWRRYPARSGFRSHRRPIVNLPEAEVRFRSDDYGEPVVVITLTNPASRPIAFWSDVVAPGGARVVDGRKTHTGEYRPLSGAPTVEVRDGGPEGRLLAREEIPR